MKPTATQLASMLLVSGAYLLAGKLALLMAIPRGYATAVWPAAGVAVVAILHGGYRMSPAVAVGSFLVNIPADLAATGTGVAAVIGLGAALQAAAAAALIRRLVGYPSPLARTSDVVRFLAAAGPVACLVGATWGVTTLLVAGFATVEAYAISWVTWWVGDTIGVVIFAPILLALVGAPRPAWARRRSTVVPPLLLGFGVVTVLFFRASAWEVQRHEAELARRADVLTRAVQRQSERYIDVGLAVASLYRANDEVTQEELSRFAEGIGERQPGILAVSWIAVVEAADRAAYEQTRRARLGPAFHIWEGGNASASIRAGDRRDYFPVDAIAPLPANRGALGFDLGSEDVRRAALQRARDTGTPSLTAPIALVQDAERQPGFLLLVPVYRPGSAVDRVEERRAALVGHSSIVVRARDLVEVAVVGLDRRGFHLRVLDQTAADGAIVLYAEAGDGSARVGVGGASFEVAGRSWRVEAAPATAPLRSQRTWQAWSVLAGGLFVVSLLGAILLIVTGNQTVLADAESRYRDLYEHSPDMYVSVSAATGLIVDCNETTVRELRRVRPELVGQPVVDLYDPSCREAAQRALADFRRRGEIHDVELRIRRGDDTLCDVSLSVTAVRDDSGQIVRSRSVWRDITERKRLERDHALKLALGDEMRATANAEELAALVAQRVGAHLDVARCFFGEVDAARGTMTVLRDLYRGVSSLAGTSSLASYSDATQADLRAGRIVAVSDSAVDPRTAARYASGYEPLGLRALLGVPLLREGRWVACLWVAHDQPRAWEPREAVLVQSIAERTWLWLEHVRMLDRLRDLNASLEERIAARTQALETTVREKDVLLREIHHRVKNNLQVISSLLTLQSMNTDDDRLRSALAQSRDRVQSLALVHDQLYRAANAATIEMDRYLRELVLSVERTHHAVSVRFEVDAAPCTLPLDQAVPCGLIVNELITNALKHAFIDGRAGTITVVAGPDDAGTLVLAVRDDGVGLPAGFDIAASAGLGMTIVDTLAQQLGAALTLRCDGGSEFSLRIPIERG